jgi:maltose alpha-D-glucosyltransferase/alpha-amylase
MVRSLHYASRAAALRLTRDLGMVMQDSERALTRRVGDVLASLDLGHVPGRRIWRRRARPVTCPHNPEDLAALLDFFLLEKAVYELSYEANARPTWVDIPARGLLDMLEASP